MQYNRTSAADEAAKNFAKDKAKKVAKKAGKKVGKHAGKLAQKAAKKIIAIVSSLLGSIPGFVLIAAILLLFLLPSIIFGSALGLDSETPDGTISTTVDWEQDAKNAIREKESILKWENFWDDMGTFFSSGTWGTSNETFKTEYAKADDIDEETGESVSSGYFSASNRIIALIDEAFRASLRDADGAALREGRKAAQNSRAEYEACAAENYPKPTYVDDADYTVNFVVQKDPTLDDRHYISQACYLLAATSVMTTDNDETGKGVRTTLDYAFALTGLENNPAVTDEICWQGVCTADYSAVEGSYIIEGATHTNYVTYDSDGNISDIISHESALLADIETPGYIDDLLEHGYHLETTKDPDIEKKTLTVTITATYSVEIKENYKDIINDMCGIDDVKAENEKSSAKDLVSASALELMKLYGAAVGFANLGDVGLPLPSGSYNITSGYGWRVDPVNGGQAFHGGVDLAAPAGTPVFAVKDGVVTVPSFDGDGFGNWCYITHTDEDSGEQFVTIYPHMLEAPYVSTGDEVVAGQQVGVVGSTGKSTGNHLHFEIRMPNIGTHPAVNPEESTIWPFIEENTKAAIAAAGG